MDIDSGFEFVQQMDIHSSPDLSDEVAERPVTPDTSESLTPHPSPSKSANVNGKCPLQDGTAFRCKRQ